jgi:hypothetical protein
VYCRDYSEPAPPTPGQISTAIQAVSQVLNQIVVDEPLLLPGVAAVQLKDNAQLRSFAQLERVFFHLPDLKAAMATAASTTAITKASQAPAAGMLRERFVACVTIYLTSFLPCLATHR